MLHTPILHIPKNPSISLHVVTPTKEGNIAFGVIKRVIIFVVYFGPALAYLAYAFPINFLGTRSPSVFIFGFWLIVMMIFAHAWIPFFTYFFKFLPNAQIIFGRGAGVTFFRANPYFCAALAEQNSRRIWGSSLCVTDIRWFFFPAITAKELPWGVRLKIIFASLALLFRPVHYSHA